MPRFPLLPVLVLLAAAACNSTAVRTDAGSVGGAAGAGSGGALGSGGVRGSRGMTGTGGATGSGGVGGDQGGTAGGSDGAAGTGGHGGTTGTGGRGGTTGSGGAGGGTGESTGGAGGGRSVACDGTCQLSTSCAGCGNGGTKKLACSCYMDNTGVGRWSCGSLGPCGSNGCGPAGAACDPHYESSCESCDVTGALQSCTCVASGSGPRGTWSCSSRAGSCGAACGDHRCLPGEICINFGQYGGVLVDGGILQPSLTPTCVAVPDACGSQPPSCAACIVSAYGCFLPGVCRDVGPQTFDCILGGA